MVTKNAVGKPVKGDDFFDRVTEQRQLWRMLEMDNVLLLAPRRVGKTSLVLRLADAAELHGFRATYASVSDVRSEAGFVEKLCTAIHRLDGGPSLFERIESSGFGAFFKRIRVGKFGPLELSVEGTAGWRELGRAVHRSLAAVDQRALLLLDELPILVLSLIDQDPSGQRARDFLNWFRDLRQDPDAGDHVRWVVAGSIGLDSVAERHQLGDTINDFHIFRLGAFSESDARAFVAALAATYDLVIDEETCDRILGRIQWNIPFFVQLLFSQLRSMAADQGLEPSPAVVDGAYERLLGPAHRAYFDFWRQRLVKQLGQPDASQALALLAAIARQPDGVDRAALTGAMSRHIGEPAARDEQLRYLTRVLEGDGYVTDDSGRWRFRSPLLRDYWIRHVID